MNIIDFHTHAFPDSLADRAVAALEAGVEDQSVKAHLDGRAASLIASMDKAGIAQSVVCSIATKPGQFDPILDWSLAIGGDRLIPLASVHPDADDVAGQVQRVKEAGLIGLKLHPMYQQFAVDDPRVDPLFAAAAEAGLIVVLHCGYDIAFGDSDLADPRRIAAMLDKHPALTFVATHTGGWRAWDAVREYLVGRDIWIETSFSLEWMSADAAVDLIRTLGVERVLFGTDSPWTDQSEEIERMRNIGLSEGELEAILATNARRLLDSL